MIIARYLKNIINELSQRAGYGLVIDLSQRAGYGLVIDLSSFLLLMKKST